MRTLNSKRIFWGLTLMLLLALLSVVLLAGNGLASRRPDRQRPAKASSALTAPTLP